MSMARGAALARRTLECHAASPCAAVEAIGVEVGVERDALCVRYRLVGDLARLRIPAIGERLDPERLWAHTCFELFVAAGTDGRYVEWNFSPSGQIARFCFDAYRRRAPQAWPGDSARSRVRLEHGGLCLEAVAPLPPGFGQRVRVSITSVVEASDDTLSYWALHHPGERADFHHAAGFVLALTLGASPAIVGA